MRTLPHRPLSRDRILDAALELADQHGVDALSMRKLAAALGVEAMSLYNHVPNKSSLLNSLLERLLEKLEIPPASEVPWAEGLRSAARSFRHLARHHPSFMRLLTTQHVHTENALRPADATLAILREAGFSADEACFAYQTLMGYILGFIMQGESGTIGLTCCARDRVDGQPETSGSTTPMWAPEVPSGRLSLHLTVARANPSSEDAAFDFGLDLILAGLAARLRS